MSVRLGISSPYGNLNKLQSGDRIRIDFPVMTFAFHAMAKQKAPDARLAIQWE
jgi:hypothetical protein